MAVVAAAGLLATVITQASPAQASPSQAAEVGGGIWDLGSSTSNCGSGQAERTCTYTFSTVDNFGEDCSELGVSGNDVIRCHASLTATVTIVPIVNFFSGAVGCETKALTTPSPTSHVSFDSNLNNAYDNDNILITEMEVPDAFGDEELSLIEFTAEDTETSVTYQWHSEGNFTGSCRRNANKRILTTPAPGSFVSVTTKV